MRKLNDDLDRLIGHFDGVDNALDAGSLLVLPKSEAPRGNPAVGRDARRLDREAADPRSGKCRVIMLAPCRRELSTCTWAER